MVNLKNQRTHPTLVKAHAWVVVVRDIPKMCGPRPDLCKLGETNQPFHFGNVRHPDHVLLPLHNTKHGRKWGKSKLSKFIFDNRTPLNQQNHMSGTESQAFEAEKQIPPTFWLSFLVDGLPRLPVQ
jgi:hypothetical protein